MTSGNTLASLTGETMYLRVATGEDIGQTHHWLLQSDPHLLSSRPGPLRAATEVMEEFKKSTRSDESALFIAIRKSDGTPIGRVRYFDYNALNRSAEVDLMIDPDLRQKGLGKQVMLMFVRYLFRYRDFYKVYAHVSSVNTAGVRLLESCGFKKDGALRRHHYYQGELHDFYIYSLLVSDIGR